MAVVLMLSYDLGGNTLKNHALLRQKLRRDGYGSDDEVTVLAWSSEANAYQHEKGIRVVSLRARFARFKPLYDLLFIWEAYRAARQRTLRPSRIVVADFALLWAGYVVRKRCGGALEMHLNNLPTDLARTRGISHRVYTAVMERLTLRLPDLFIVINETTMAYLLERGVQRDRIRVRVPDTIRQDLGLISRTTRGRARARYNLAEGSPLVLSVGRLEPEKGFEELLGVFVRMNRRATLVIVGDGSQRDELSAKCEKLGIVNSVVMTGREDREHLWDLYRDADAFVLLSHSEALGLVVWEAMYMEVPVIGRPIGGIKESIGEDGLRGFFWDTSDGADEFCRKLTLCLERSEDIDAMVSRARTYVGERIGSESAK